jgi:hypothetical protein
VLIPQIFQGSFEYIGQLATTANDVLGRHWYELSLAYGTGSHFLGYSATYLYNAHIPAIFGGISEFAIPNGARLFAAPGLELSSRLFFWERRLNLFGGLAWSLEKPVRSELSAYYHFEWRRPLHPFPLLYYSDEPATLLIDVESDAGYISGIGLKWDFGNSRRYPFSISEQDGRNIALAADYYPNWLGSDFNMAVITMEAREYLTLPWLHHILALRLVKGDALGNSLRQRTFYLGGAMGESYLTPRNSRIFMLRGYPDFIFSGQHVILGSAEYRFPLIRVFRGIGTLPAFLQDLSALVFGDSGNAFDNYNSNELSQFHVGVGGELRADMIFSYNTPLSLRLGYGHGLNNDEAEQRLYFELGTSF